ncbi:hypothetical protein SO694_00039142 [Aureococcus anophagefferens]|uniref:U-box domain-containing protein n=1 Tax=Aureococcus anophagefferens TaxID=44056 RepID=A0ABR1FLJ6_AURAN
MEPPSCACACGSAGGAGSPPPDGSALEGAAILTTLGDACEAGPEPVPGSNPQHSTTAAAPPAEDAAPPVEDDDDLPDELFCPITYTMMRDPVRASDGHVYERAAITLRWFAQRLTSPMTGAALADGALEPQDALRERIYDWAVARRGSPASATTRGAYCGDEAVPRRGGCREAFERQCVGGGRRRPAAAAGPAAAAAAARGRRRGPRAAPPPRAATDASVLRGARCDARVVLARGYIKIASGAVLVPVATVTVAAVFAVGAACGSVTLAAGIVKELVGGGVDAASMTYAAIGDAISSDVVELHVADDAARALPPPDAAA